MNKIIFDIQRFTEDNSGDTASDALELMHSIIQRFDLKTVDDTKLQGGSSTLNSTLKFIGTFWGSLFFKKSTRTTEVNALTTMLAGTVSIVEDIYAIREEKNKNNPSEVLITAKAEDLISNLTSLTNSFQKLASGKNSFILSIVSSVVGLAANLVLSMDGLKEDEIEKINKSYVSLLQVSSAEIIKKFFSAGLADNLIKMPVSQILDNPAVKAEIRKQTATNFTKGSGPLGLIFAAITGILNAANEYDSRVKKYTEDEIPEDITKHDARIDAIATFVHDTASYYAKGFDDTVFKWIQAGLSFIRGEDIPYYTDKNYVEVITDWFKTLNYENSGTSGDDKFYVLENKSMVYGDSGKDDIGNYGFSNVTIWGGHDDDTLGSYKTDSATPQNNSIFGGPGNDQISVYDKDSTIYGGTGKDFINVVGTNNEIFGEADDDKFYIANGANNNTLSGDNGDDFIVMLEDAKNTVIKYASGDGNDTIYGFNEDDSLKISGSYKTTVDGNNLKFTVDEGSILLVNMAGKNIKINGKTIKSGKENSTIEPLPPPEFPTLPATVASPFIYGTESDDTINNTLDNVVIEALGGRDEIYNGGHWYGNYFDGGSNVTILGGDGNDAIRSYGSESTISGGNGDDWILISGSDKSSINGDTGNDKIYNGGYWYEGRNYVRHSGGSKVTMSGGSGNDTIYNGGKDSNNTYGANEVSISCGDGDDNIYNHGLEATINCGNGNDYVFNGDGGYGDKTSISGGDGNDSIENYDDKVTVSGGIGDDKIYLGNFASLNVIQYKTGDGNDSIKGFNSTSTLSISGGSYSMKKSGDDIIVTVDEEKITLVDAASLLVVHIEFVEDSSSDSKLITLTEGNDNYSNTVEGATINALGGNDSIYNNGSSVSIDGGAGNDLITTEHGNKVTIISGKGNDSIYNNGNSASIDGGVGNDLITTEYANKVTIISGKGNDSIYNNGNSVSIDGGVGNDLITTEYANKVTINGGAGNDLITTEYGNNVTISGGDGNDSINCGAGNDKLYGNAGNDSLVGGDGADTLSGSTGDDKLYGDKGNDSLVGGSGDDKLYGGAGNDNLSGGTGSDTLSGGSGNDTLTGGKGHDLFIYSAGNDVIADFAAGDKISIGAAISGTSIKGSDATFTINKNTLTVKNGKGKEVTVINAKGKEQTLIGGALIVSKSATLENWREVGDASTATAKVKLTGNAKNNTLFGSSKDDTLIGAVGADKLFGNAGNDSLSGGDGADTLSGGAGNDKLYGGKGNDSLWGGAGNDSLWGNAGADTFIYANGEGKDVIYNFDNSDILQITGTFTSSYNKSKKEIAFTVGKTTSALTLKSFTATSFNINGDTYKISGSKLIK